MNLPPRPTFAASTIVVVVLMTIGLGRPAFAQQNRYAVLEFYNAADDLKIPYDLRWGSNGFRWEIEDRGHNFNNYAYEFPGQDRSPTPTIAFESGIGQQRGEVTYQLEAYASPDKERNGNVYVFIKRLDAAGAPFLDVVKLETYITGNIQVIDGLREQKKYDEAIARCDKALNIKLGDPRTANRRGLCHREKGEEQLAVNDFGLAGVNDPQHAAYPYNRGLALMALGKYDFALKAFELSARLDPLDADPVGQRGLAKAQLGNRAGALEDFAREVQLDPKRTLRTLPGPVEVAKIAKPTPTPTPAKRAYVKAFEPYITREAFEALEGYRLGSKVDAKENARLQAAYDKAYEESRYNDIQEANYIRTIQREPVAALWKMMSDPFGNSYFLASFTPVEERLAGMKRPLVGEGSTKHVYVKSKDDLSGLRVAVRRKPSGPGDGGLETAAIFPLRWIQGQGIVPLAPPDNLRVMIRLGGPVDQDNDQNMLGMSFSMDPAPAASGGGVLRPEIYTSPSFGMNRYSGSPSTTVSPRGCMDCHSVGFNTPREEYASPKIDRDPFALAVRKMPGFGGLVADARKNGATDQDVKDIEAALIQPDMGVLRSPSLTLAVLKLWNAIYQENQPYLDDSDGRFLEFNESYGTAWLDAGELDKALAHFDKAIARGPSYASIYIKRAVVYTRKGRRKDAGRDLEKAFGVEPKNPYAYLARCGLRIAEEDYRRAWEDADQAIFLAPKRAVGYQARARVSNLRGDDDAALKDLNRAIELESTWIEPIHDKAWLLATSPNDGVRDGTEAVKLASRADQMASGKSPKIRDTLAAAYASSGDFARAIEFQEKVLNDPASAKQLGEVGLTLAQDRLKLYRGNHPYREAAPPPR